VYFVTPNWNPAVEDQAVARCHRIGQESEIDVFSFKMESFDDENFTKTLDKYVKDVQRFKRTEAKILEPEELGEELEDKCAICLSPQHEHTHCRLDCGHCFHDKCIHTWLRRGQGCPLCRQ